MSEQLYAVAINAFLPFFRRNIALMLKRSNANKAIMHETLQLKI